MKKEKNQARIISLETAKKMNESSTQILIRNADEMRQELAEIEPKCSYKKFFKSKSAGVSAAGLALLALFPNPVTFLFAAVACIHSTLSFVKIRESKFVRARLENELREKEDGIVQLNEENLDIKFRLLEEKYPEE